MARPAARGWGEGVSYDDEMYKAWRAARIKFIADNPATARALSLKVPSPSGEEHIASENCWCGPEAAYVDPETGATVFVHRRVQ